MTWSASGDPARRSVRRWAVALVCWVAFVWGHSLVQGPESALESGRVVSLLRPLFEALGLVDEDVMTFLVRKYAHFSEYAVLGVLGHGLFSRLPAAGIRRRWPVVAAVALVPVADEFLQLFVPGRTGSVRDVAIDLAGALTGALVARLVSRRRLARGVPDVSG